MLNNKNMVAKAIALLVVTYPLGVCGCEFNNNYPVVDMVCSTNTPEQDYVQLYETSDIVQKETVCVSYIEQPDNVVLNNLEIEAQILVKHASNGKEYKYYSILYEDEIYTLTENLQEYLYDLCIQYGIEEYYEILLCQLFHESHYNEKAISSTHDYGLAQINKFNHKWLEKELGITDFLDGKQSILCNVYMMSDLIEHYGIEKALTCYNTGKPNVKNRYASSVLKLVDENMIMKESDD